MSRACLVAPPCVSRHRGWQEIRRTPKHRQSSKSSFCPFFSSKIRVVNFCRVRGCGCSPLAHHRRVIIRPSTAVVHFLHYVRRNTTRLRCYCGKANDDYDVNGAYPASKCSTLCESNPGGSSWSCLRHETFSSAFEKPKLNAVSTARLSKAKSRPRFGFREPASCVSTSPPHCTLPSHFYTRSALSPRSPGRERPANRSAERETRDDDSTSPPALPCAFFRCLPLLSSNRWQTKRAVDPARSM